jgi:hypothetical protein
MSSSTHNHDSEWTHLVDSDKLEEFEGVSENEGPPEVHYNNSSASNANSVTTDLHYYIGTGTALRKLVPCTVSMLCANPLSLLLINNCHAHPTTAEDIYYYYNDCSYHICSLIFMPSNPSSSHEGQDLNWSL